MSTNTLVIALGVTAALSAVSENAHAIGPESCYGDHAIVDVHRLWLEEGRPLSALALIDELPPETPGLRDIKVQIQTTLGSSRQEDKSSNAHSASRSLEDCEGRTLMTERALPRLIADIAKARPDVVVVNESHVEQQHRAFFSELLDGLHEIGFGYVGGETFSHQISETLNDGVPDSASGVYTADPFLAESLRRAASRGMQMFGYDGIPPADQLADLGWVERVEARERLQAARIADFVERRGAAGKLLVFVGSAHGSKTSGEDGVTRMAGMLEANHGLKVYSIDQVGSGSMLDTTDLNEERCIDYHRSGLSVPSVMARADSSLVSRSGFDVTVFHPATSERPYRLSWLHQTQDRQVVQLDIPSVAYPSVIKAFRKQDPRLSVPSDQTLLSAGATTVTLVLPPGVYRVERESRDCEQVVLRELSVGLDSEAN